MTAPLLADLALNPDRVVQLVVNVLAVGGAFLAGQGLTGVVVWLLDRWLTRGKTPPGFKRVVRLIGGAAAAVLAALILFGHGTGYTFLGGGSPGPDNGTPSDLSPGTGKGGADAPSPPSTEPSRPAPPPTRPAALTGERVAVKLLGGDDVKNERFYLIGDDPAPKTLAEAKAAITARKAAATQPLGVEVRFTATNALPASHPAVLLLTAWAQANGMPVTLPAETP